MDGHGRASLTLALIPNGASVSAARLCRSVVLATKATKGGTRPGGIVGRRLSNVVAACPVSRVSSCRNGQAARSTTFQTRRGASLPLRSLCSLWQKNTVWNGQAARSTTMRTRRGASFPCVHSSLVHGIPPLRSETSWASPVLQFTIRRSETTQSRRTSFSSWGSGSSRICQS